MIEFNHVSKTYPDGTKAVDDLNLHIEQGEFFVLIGPSGCGKTTTMKLINGLIDTTDGDILIHRRNIRDYNLYELRWNIGYVLQQIALFPHMTIEENIAVVPELRKWSKNDIRTRVDDLLDMVNLDPDTYRNRKPHELSGGQQQRVGVVRALAANPDIILMDEPFSALDPMSRDQLQRDIAALQKRIRKTIVFVTHDMQEALALGDRICLMRDGKVLQCGTPQEVLQHPADDFVRDFISARAAGPISTITDGIWLLEQLLQPTELQCLSNEAAPLSFQASLSEMLSRLAQEDVIPIEQDGELVGTVNRQAVVQFLAERMEAREIG